jgi:hypothetical protein
MLRLSQLTSLWMLAYAEPGCETETDRDSLVPSIALTLLVSPVKAIGKVSVPLHKSNCGKETHRGSLSPPISQAVVALVKAIGNESVSLQCRSK